MTPDEVPGELVELARESVRVSVSGTPTGQVDLYRNLLADVLPGYAALLADNLRNDGMSQFDPVPSWALEQLRGETGA